MYSGLETPCYIFDKTDFENNINMFCKVLEKYFDNKYILGYSFKTNYLPFIINDAKEIGCYAEVVSEKEYEMAKYLKYEKHKVIYNGPVKTKRSFLEAVNNGAIVNIDSNREISWLEELDPNKNFVIGIRVNFDIEKELPGHTLMGDEGGRFGFCDDNGSLHDAIERIRELGNIKLNCLHMHISSKTKSVDIYRNLVKRAITIKNREKLDLEYIDLGGSFFGGGDDGTEYEKYISAVYDELKVNNSERLGIIVEPGASVISTSVKYLTEVVDVKDTTYNRFVTCDGSRLHLDPFFVKTKYTYSLITKKRENIKTQVVSGFTCMEKDRIMSLKDKQTLDIGDRIVFNVVGSYTMCMNSDFISSEPNVYMVDGCQIKLIRRNKCIQQYLENNMLE